jgi:hypothetical protein
VVLAGGLGLISLWVMIGQGFSSGVLDKSLVVDVHCGHISRSSVKYDSMDEKGCIIDGDRSSFYFRLETNETQTLRVLLKAKFREAEMGGLDWSLTTSVSRFARHKEHRHPRDSHEKQREFDHHGTAHVSLDCNPASGACSHLVEDSWTSSLEGYYEVTLDLNHPGESYKLGADVLLEAALVRVNSDREQLHKSSKNLLLLAGALLAALLAASARSQNKQTDWLLAGGAGCLALSFANVALLAALGAALFQCSLLLIQRETVRPLILGSQTEQPGNGFLLTSGLVAAAAFLVAFPEACDPDLFPTTHHSPFVTLLLRALVGAALAQLAPLYSRALKTLQDHRPAQQWTVFLGLFHLALHFKGTRALTQTSCSSWTSSCSATSRGRSWPGPPSTSSTWPPSPCCSSPPARHPPPPTPKTPSTSRLKNERMKS